VSFLAAILAALRAIPALGKFVQGILDFVRDIERRANEKEASDRLVAKDAAADAAIERVRASQDGQQQPPDAKT
jgi:hypothetical protein